MIPLTCLPLTTAIDYGHKRNHSVAFHNHLYLFHFCKKELFIKGTKIFSSFDWYAFGLLTSEKDIEI